MAKGSSASLIRESDRGGDTGETIRPDVGGEFKKMRLSRNLTRSNDIQLP